MSNSDLLSYILFLKYSHQYISQKSPTKHYVQVEEMPEPMFYDEVRQCEQNRACASFPPCVASPKSRYISWSDVSVLDFALIGTPIHSNH